MSNMSCGSLIAFLRSLIEYCGAYLRMSFGLVFKFPLLVPRVWLSCSAEEGVGLVSAADGGVGFSKPGD